MGHFLPFYHPKNQKFEKKEKKKKMPGDIILLYIHMYHKWRSYDIWFLKYKVWQTKIFNILGLFCPVSLLTTWKIKILTSKKTTGDTTILHICTINDNHMIHGSWDIKCDRHNFLSFWTWRYYLFTNINDNHMMYSSSGTECNGQNFCHFGLFFAFLPP